MCPLADTWKHDAAVAYVEVFRTRGLSLELVGGRLRIPPGHTPAEVELVCLLKPELIAILEERTQGLQDWRIGIL